MASRIAGSARTTQLRSSRLQSRLLKLLIALVVLAVVAVLVHNNVMSKANGKPTPKATQQQLSYGAKQASDVTLVAGAVGQYAAANGVLPTRLSTTGSGSLVLCGATCDATDYGVGGFSVYQASNIKLAHYSTGLTAPNQNIMYLVPGAKCSSDGRAGEPNPGPRSMVILYQTVTGTGTVPRCVVL